MWVRIVTSKWTKPKFITKIYDRSVRAVNFDVNDQVKVLNTAIDPSITKKFKKKWVGPFLIVSKSGPDYVIKPMSAKGRRRTVNQNKLQRYNPRELILPNSGEYNTPMDIKQEESRHMEQQAAGKRRQRKPRRPKRSSHHHSNNSATAQTSTTDQQTHSEQCISPNVVAPTVTTTRYGRISKATDRYSPS